MLGVLVLGISTRALAGGAWSGALSYVHFFQNGVVLVVTSGTRVGLPACATTQPNRFAIDVNTAGGRAQAAGLMMAYTAGKNVVIQGTGACNVYSDSESIDYFYTSDP
jgi:hypothetical protein